MDDFTFLEELRKRGLKSVRLEHVLGGPPRVVEAEFFPLAPAIPPLDLDTLIPPPPAEDNPPNEPPRSQFKTAPALAALLTKPSVS